MSTPALRSRRSLYGMLAASSMSIIGTRVSLIALPWFVLVETKSAALMGLVLTFEMAPYVVSKALSGPLIDRHGPRLISVLGDLLSGAFLALIPILYAAGQLNLPDRIPMLLLLVSLAGVVRGPGDGARNAMIPAVADATGVSLDRITGLDSTVDRASMLLGAGIGGLLVGGLGAPQTVAFTALGAWASALLVALFIPPVVAPSDEEDESYFAQLRAGAQFLRQDKLLRSILGMFTVNNMLEAAYVSVLLPLWLHDQGYGAEYVGLLGVLNGGAAVVASLAATKQAGNYNRQLGYLLCFTLSGPPRFLALAVGAPLPVIIVANIVSGAGAGFINPMVSSLFFERVPRHLVGRVGSLSDAVAWAGLPIGGVVGGAVVGLVGVAPALGLASAGYAVSTALPGMRPEWREMDRRRATLGRSARRQH